ncbi:PspC domain-containing protein [Myroides sp. M-43]|uniref:PspC domain-containing protein n=1 Tax=Myroides oncorhynchi TaxID=2893756 RepID=UPI001E5A6CE1|nr:PspC domain-containing protein [Myroides oncorhynchi]MCC9042945.1 PspC domain-containing protein [Myroides oncorhynchi]
MNKTLTINIAGSVFHIDENAYLKLDQYLKAIKRSFPKEEQDEIIHDIEIRIAELFSENISDSNQVITIADVDRVISIMGSPEDYVIDEEPTTTNHTQYIYNTSKKLYRDGDRAMVGGVLAGLGHYFKIDTVWMRIIFMVLVLFYGTGVLLYLILWIIVPEAKTTSQILEMQREPINISTIEKKVKENVSYVTDKINGIDYDSIKQQTARAGERSGKVVLNIIGIAFIVISAMSIFAAIIGVCGAWINKDLILQSTKNEIPLFISGMYPYWMNILLMTTLTTLPFVGLLIIGLRMIYSNIKYVMVSIIGLIVIWFIALGLFTIPFLNAKNYEDFNYTIETSSTERSDDTEFSFTTETPDLTLKLITPNYFTSDKSTVEGYEVTEVNSLLPITIEILPTFQDGIYGNANIHDKSPKTINNKFKSINVEYDQFEKTNNQLLISTELTENAKMTYTIYLPKGKKIYLNDAIKALITSQSGFTPGNHWYEMQEDSTLKCTDC